MGEPLVVYIDMDDVLCDYSSAFQQKLKENPLIAYPQSQYNFFATLEPIGGAIESVKRMIDDPRFSPYILTAPSFMNPLCYSEKRVWVEKQFGLEFTKNLIISYDKSLLKGDVLIDDNVGGNGQDKFSGKLLQFGSQEFPNWPTVMDKLFILAS
tara:strand:- start:2837 stop:3298 length:462 start_codon:yes stop_codon:yes gene_type:complete